MDGGGHFQFLDRQTLLQQAVCSPVRSLPPPPHHMGCCTSITPHQRFCIFSVLNAVTVCGPRGETQKGMCMLRAAPCVLCPVGAMCA